MIVPTMNDDEMAFEAIRMTNWLYQCYKEWKPEIERRFRNGTRFPYFQRAKLNDDKGNVWTYLFYCPSKAMKRKKIYYSTAYITYDIPPKRKKLDLNAGKGCLLFDPIAMKRRLEERHLQGSFVIDIVPHVFNRYTERYLKPLGRDKIEFAYKVEDILYRMQWFDILADKVGDENARKHMDEGIAPYDVMMKGGGILRGHIMSDLLLRMHTYVGKDIMFENQLYRQQEMLGEYQRIKQHLFKDCVHKDR